MQSTPERLLALLEEHGLTEYAADATSLLRPSIAMFSSEVDDEQQIAIGASKLGGLPDLPPDMQWPYYHERPLYFVAQINFAEVAPYDVEKVLPSSGIAYFFYDDEWHEEKPTNLFNLGKTFFFDGDLSLLKRTDLPYSAVWPACSVSFKNDMTLPPGQSWKWFDNSEAYTRLNDENNDNYEEVYWAMNLPTDDSRSPHHRLLGHPDPVQGNIFVEAQRELNKQDSWDGLDEQTPTWTLLLQIDSDNNANMMWGDVGTLYFCIKNDALHNRHFDETIVVFQCG